MPLDFCPDRDSVVWPLADRGEVPAPFRQQAADGANLHRSIGGRDVGFAESVPSIHRERLLRTSPHEPEHVLAVHVSRGAHTPSTQHAPVAVQPDIRVAGIHIAFREQVRETRRRDPEPIGQRLKLAVPALLAKHTKMVAFYEQHFDQTPAMFEQLRRVGFDHHARRTWHGARGLGPTVHAYGADPARSIRVQVFVSTQPRNVNPCGVRRLQNRLPRPGFDFRSVDLDLERLRHGRILSTSGGEDRGRAARELLRIRQCGTNVERGPKLVRAGPEPRVERRAESVQQR